jgi:hypothetical protein
MMQAVGVILFMLAVMTFCWLMYDAGEPPLAH